MEGWSNHAIANLPDTAFDESDIVVKAHVTYNDLMQSDFADIRFVDSDGTTLLNQQRITYETGVSAVWYVEVPIKPAAGKTIFMWYGNGNASLKNDTVAAFYWRGEADKNMEITGTNYSKDEDKAYLSINGSAEIKTVDAVSTWHSIANITLKLGDHNKNRYFGMGRYYKGPGGGPFAAWQNFCSDSEECLGSCKSLTVGGPPLAIQELSWPQTMPTVDYCESNPFILSIERFTLSYCYMYLYLSEYCGWMFPMGEPLMASHYGDSCNNTMDEAIGVFQTSNGAAAEGALTVLGIEVFNLPEFIIDIDDWIEIEPEDVSTEGKQHLELWKSVAEVESEEYVNN